MAFLTRRLAHRRWDSTGYPAPAPGIRSFRHPDADSLSISLLRKGVRVVYGCSLENCRNRQVTVGSNPTPSAASFKRYSICSFSL